MATILRNVTDALHITRPQRKIHRMNWGQIEGDWKQFEGKVQQQWGKFTDDDLTQIEGNYEKFVGKVQERYGDKKDELMKWADQWHQKSTPDDSKTRM